MCVGETTTRPRPHFLVSGSKVDGWVERRRLFQCAATERLGGQGPAGQETLACKHAGVLINQHITLVLHQLRSRRIIRMFANCKQVACEQRCQKAKMRKGDNEAKMNDKKQKGMLQNVLLIFNRTLVIVVQVSEKN